ncbi:MAG: DUF2442 domain-containing protein [Lachnospiraceae bacterium]|nr:DUF2442 domain-containing protein [Lachnospiraceae bacterium]
MFPKVMQVVPMKDFSVYVYFEDGKIVCYDMTQMLEKEAFQTRNVKLLSHRKYIS